MFFGIDDLLSFGLYIFVYATKFKITWTSRANDIFGYTTKLWIMWFSRMIYYLDIPQMFEYQFRICLLCPDLHTNVTWSRSTLCSLVSWRKRISFKKNTHITHFQKSQKDPFLEKDVPSSFLKFCAFYHERKIAIYKQHKTLDK